MIAGRATALAGPVLALALAGCQPVPAPVRAPRASVQVEPPGKGEGWQQIATPADVERIRRLDSAWQEALADVRRAGRGGEIRAAGDLLRPDSALDRPAPTPGSYNCQLIKLGRLTRRTQALEKFKPFFCYVEVENELLTIVKQTGSERPAGRLWEDDDPRRLIFLGSLAVGTRQPKAYGDDPKRDMAGVLERVGPFRWRLVIPWPQSKSKLDVYELTPVSDQPASR